ncbi:hypothetical protein B6A14_09005 [Polynucleobacter hirudinilacicola]|uniref:Cyclic nucleotide-binding domain-containing protein n=2 Tax=Polynucleobacter hirudinilacicola TaxID=1743166 RepID=A0A210RY20_9BURK|nr:hypothetical protein B6A14_09005 [Polynucleobacter hirudinilacicola]
MKFFFKRPKLFLLVLALLNYALGHLMSNTLGTPWGWQETHLNLDKLPVLSDILSALQFALFAFTLDCVFRISVLRMNARKRHRQIPAVLVQAGTILIYTLIGLLGFILLYDQSISTLLAASGALGLAVGYAFRDLIADVAASITLQADHLIAIGDWVEYSENGNLVSAQIKEMDRRYVSLETNGDLRVFRIPNNRFLALQFTNISQQTQQSIREAVLQLDIQYNEDRILEILNAALEYVCRNNPEFTGWFRNYVTLVQTGSVTYKIRYECASDYSANQSKHLVLKSILRFLKSSGISLESSILVQSVSSLHSSHFPPLQNVYPFGILKVLSEEEVVKLSDNAISLHYNAGQQIISRGEMADSMYIIAEGILEVVAYKDNGEKVILASLWPGDCVGEMSLLTGEPRSADVFARDNAHLIEIRKQDLAPILQAKPILVERISSLLAMRMAQNEKTLSLANQQEAVNERRQTLTKKIMSFFSKL